ncbi:hypothetical protein [Pseudomonas sp. 5P_3.1_Bac2]|uniref:hypothetical protein n=1 Tax=Pseudomonas sp. 5P_3.1_Bac2 TaxID=2971617 RepID=UPI0021C9CD2C|nr:hypothetical protein [Pseudomonas sp. 5P_3.1_Bac2]MCU1717692.1 hypothetical protein [Pseudomonas sp. 5P_3.1_Bac2]
MTNGNSTYCYQDKDSGCGTFNGKEGCFETESGCGTFNGVWGCYPIDKEQRNCGYAAGEQVCFDPKNPTVQIPTSSPDHPKNGGNADGNDKNDPKAPGGSGSSPQGGDEGATNEAIDQLGDDLGAKIDKTNSLLGGITDILDGIAEGLTELTEGLLGDDYDGSGDGDSGELAGIGEGAGSELAQMFSQQLTDAEEQELAQDESYLDQIASDVDHPSFLGEDSRFAQLLEFADDLLPSHTGCVDYSVPLELGRYKSTITLPVCRIATLRPLLEYIIYIITAIGLWNIAYSTLRMENAKAAKGGF